MGVWKITRSLFSKCSKFSIQIDQPSKELNSDLASSPLYQLLTNHLKIIQINNWSAKLSS